MGLVHKNQINLDAENYYKGDYLLIRDGEVIAVSGNSEFEDGDEVAIEVKAGDNIAKILETIDEFYRKD